MADVTTGAAERTSQRVPPGVLPAGAPPAPPSSGGARTLRRGFALLGRGIREQPGIFAVAVLGSAVYGAMTVAQARILGAVVDRVVVPAFEQGRTSTAALLVAALVILAASALKAAGIVGRRLGAGIMQYRLQAAYRRRVTRQYLRLPLSWHQRHPTGQLLSNANADVEAMWFVVAPLPMAVGVLVMLAVAGVAMVLTDPVLAAVAALVFPAIFGLNVAYQRRLSPLATRAQQLRASVSAVAHESFDGALVVKTLGREAAETARFRRVAEELRDAQISVGRVRGAFDPMIEALPSLGILAVLLLGAGRVERGALAPGDLVQVAYLFTLLAFPIRAIGWVLGELPRSLVGWERVRAVLEAGGGLAYGARSLPAGAQPATLQVEGVDYAYEGAADEAVAGPRVPVLSDVTLELPAGRTVAVVGPTGAGKSTLTTLLVRLVDPDSGRIVLDGLDLRELPQGGVPAAAALVAQQTFLFDDTVRDNVTLGLAVGDDEVRRALELAQASEFVDALPAGLDTMVGERGASLSGGQRQRLALSRALVRRPRLLILDDATSSVDPRVEAAILAGLRTSGRPGEPPPTLVVVAYRKATIGLADEVLYLEQGQVRDRGTSAELLVRSPGYARLVNAYERADAERVALEREGRDLPPLPDDVP